MFNVSGILHHMYLNALQKIAGAAMKCLWLAQIGEMPGLEGGRKLPAHGDLWSNLRSMATLRQAPRPIPLALGEVPHVASRVQGLAEPKQFLRLCLRFPTALAAETLFLRKQLALYQECHVTPRRATDATRLVLTWLSRWFDWRQVLVLVQPPCCAGIA